MNYFNFKKWYFDLITDNGQQTIYLYFVILKIFGFHFSHVGINFLDGASNHKKSSQNFYGRPNYSNNTLILDGNFFKQEKDCCKLLIQFPEIYVELNYSSMEPLWSATTDGKLFGIGDKMLSWVVPQPKARVEGKLIYSGNEISLKGFGYQDIVEMTIPFWSLHISELYWGRAHCGENSVIFNRVMFTEGKCLQYLYVIQNNNVLYEGESFSIKNENNENVVHVINEKLNLCLKHKSTIEEAPVVTSERIKGTLLNRLLSKISGNPFERKIVSDATLKIDGEVIEGFSIHEKVTWQRNGLLKQKQHQ